MEENKKPKRDANRYSEDLLAYAKTVGLLGELKEHKVISESEYRILKDDCMKEYGVLSDFSVGRNNPVKERQEGR